MWTFIDNYRHFSVIDISGKFSIILDMLVSIHKFQNFMEGILKDFQFLEFEIFNDGPAFEIFALHSHTSQHHAH